jgi:pimeloyl-ACP methyl ester carboxylesterase
MPVRNHTAELDGHLVHWVSASERPLLWLHGVPDSAELWTPFLERCGGLALDLPGFGRSGKRGDFPYSIDGYGELLPRFLDHVGLERVTLVAHDWGAVGLTLGERIEGLVLIDPVPFVPGYRWHPYARLWRRRVVGELAMGATLRPTLWLAPGFPRRRARAVMEHLDPGTQRAILRLYRSAGEDRLAQAAELLDAVNAPATVVHGERDPFIPAAMSRAVADRLGARVELVSEAGHWPWLDDPAAFERIVQAIPE